MTRICSICNCAQMNNSVKFHVLPKNKGIRKQWIEVIKAAKGDSWQQKKLTYVCSKHFSISSYKTQNASNSNKVFLKTDAVPVYYKTDKNPCTIDFDVKNIDENSNNNMQAENMTSALFDAAKTKKPIFPFGKLAPKKVLNGNVIEGAIMMVSQSKANEICELEEEAKELEWEESLGTDSNKGEITCDAQMRDNIDEQFDQLEMENEEAGTVIVISESAAKDLRELEEEAIKFECECEEHLKIHCKMTKRVDDLEVIGKGSLKWKAQYIENVNVRDFRDPEKAFNHWRFATSYINELQNKVKVLKQKCMGLGKHKHAVQKF